MNHCGAAGFCFLATGVEELRAALAGFHLLVEALPEAPDALEREYVRLFLRPRAEVVSPWQSCHEEPRQLMGAAHDDALAWYRRYGWETKHPNEPADHLGLLLQFYAYLASLHVDARELDAFRERHLAWIPAVCKQIRLETREPFYARLAEFTMEQLESLPAGALESCPQAH